MKSRRDLVTGSQFCQDRQYVENDLSLMVSPSFDHLMLGDAVGVCCRSLRTIILQRNPIRGQRGA